ncbi:hypothetical protein QYE76_055324 [Lolium multiflorum]|uniref:Uncharacterized protein n=1 Tax=Lolium multiflorum TaxID=4521 RepID=A0AAD8WPC6_LOLMU|nr:hypothetical protein QYE76_055324 [Lolium multiflorum]
MLGSPPATKLTRSNFLFWKTLVFPAIRGAMVMGLLEGIDRAPAKLISSKDTDGKDITITNPAYAAWMARDQAVVSYLLQSLSPELLPHVFGLETTEAVWNAITRMFSTASPAKVNALRGALNNTKKSSMTMAQFFAKMKGYASELVALGKTLDESELITYLLNGLDGTYNDAVASANGQPVSPPLSIWFVVARVTHALEDALLMMMTAAPAVVATVATAAMLIVVLVAVMTTVHHAAIVMMIVAMAIAAIVTMIVVPMAVATVVMMVASAAVMTPLGVVVMMDLGVMVVAADSRVHPLSLSMLLVRFVPFMAIPPASVGGVIKTALRRILMMTVIARTSLPMLPLMELIRTGTPTHVPQTTSPAS